MEKAVEKLIISLGKKYAFAESGTLKTWQTWLVLGVFAGFVVSMVYIANNRLEFERGSASHVSSYSASSGFSAQQGPVWFYRSRNLSTNAIANMTLLTGDANCGGWPSCWKGNEQYLLLWPDGGHPGGQYDAIRVFRAPQSGTVRVTGSVADSNAGGYPSDSDGVTVYIEKGGSKIWKKTIPNGAGSIPITPPNFSVTKGQEILFGINKNSLNNWYDSTVFNPTITYVSGAGISTVSPPPPPTPPPPMPSPIPPPVTGSQKIFYRQPANLKIADIALAQPSVLPKNKTVLILWGQGSNAASTPISWQVGKFTGVYPAKPYTNYQRGKTNEYNQTAVQSYRDAIGIFNAPPSSLTTQSKLVPIILQYEYPVGAGPRPWKQATSELRTAMELNIPSVSVSGGAVGYVQASLAIHDTITPGAKPFWVQVSAFDTRNSFPESVDMDTCAGCTNLAMVISGFRNGTQYTHIVSGSAVSNGSSWLGFRKYEFGINRSELEKMIQGVKRFSQYANISANPSDYEILLVGVLNEIYYPAGSSAHVGSSIRNLKMYEVY